MVSGGPHGVDSHAACLVVIYGESLGRRIDINATPILIGRSDEADLQLIHRSVSRRHCEIVPLDGGYRLRDLGATNPTRLNGHPLPNGEAALTDADQITVGDNVLKFVSHASLEAKYHEAVYQLARRDALTELFNRRYFLELLEREIGRARRHAAPLALAIADIDLFKDVNDHFGHAEGDHVLRDLAKRLRQHMRAEDTVARIGGEEFAVVFPDADAGTAFALAERLREVIESTPLASRGAGETTISIGLANLDATAATVSDLLQAADKALYRAKAEGRNCVRA